VNKKLEKSDSKYNPLFLPPLEESVRHIELIYHDHYDHYKDSPQLKLFKKNKIWGALYLKMLNPGDAKIRTLMPPFLYDGILFFLRIHGNFKAK